MTDQQSSYRQIMKATSIFGGVQVFNILISIIRSKFVAILLGPEGIGIMGLFTSTIGIISNLTNFGLGISAVKDIAAAHGTGNDTRIGIVVTAFRRMVWITGILGLSTTILLSTWLSQLIFGNKDYKLAFIWLSFTLLFNQLSSGQFVILQGLRKLKYLAKANIAGSAIGLFVTLPLYYIYGINGIVPGIISTSIISLSIAWYFSKKVKVKQIEQTLIQSIKEGKNMLSMGFMISLSSLMTIGASYIVQIFISKTSGIEQVGLYSSGFSFLNTYVGLIFTAMATDYYPRLSAIALDNKECLKAINQQAELSILILSPLILVSLVFLNWIIVLFYSTKFLPIADMIYWAAFGIIFKALSWSIAMIFLAKGDNKLFFWNELITNIYFLGLNIIGYHTLELTGLGISFFISYFIYTIQVFIICKIKYDLNFNLAFYKILMLQLILIISCFFVVIYFSSPYKYLFGLFLIILSVLYSWFILNKRLGIIQSITKKLN